jgi:periplasmic protein TonB
MPRDLFGAVTSTPVSLGNRKWYTVPLSLAAHVALIVPVILVPLLATDTLPLPREYNVFVSPAPTPPPPPPPVPPKQEKTEPPANPDAAPVVAPNAITPERVPNFDLGDPADTGVLHGVPGGVVIGGDPPLPPPVAQAPPAPVRPGGDIRPPRKTHDVLPVYPAIAQAARVQGTVVLQARIGVTGKVEDLQVLRSIPLLDRAAIDAVSQWEYAATLLNGVPVPVIMTVTVTFTLAGK